MNRSGYGYRCAAGESWDSVALKIYGDEKYAADLLAANPALCRLLIFTGGEKVHLPTLEVPTTEAAVYTPAAAPWKD